MTEKDPNLVVVEVRVPPDSTIDIKDSAGKPLKDFEIKSHPETKVRGCIYINGMPICW